MQRACRGGQYNIQSPRAVGNFMRFVTCPSCSQKVPLFVIKHQNTYGSVITWEKKEQYLMMHFVEIRELRKKAK